MMLYLLVVAGILPLALGRSNFSVTCSQHVDYNKHVMNTTCTLNYTGGAPDLMAVECFQRNLSSSAANTRVPVARMTSAGTNSTMRDVQIFYNNTEHALHVNSRSQYSLLYECDFLGPGTNVTSNWTFYGNPVASTYLQGVRNNSTLCVLVVNTQNLTVTLQADNLTIPPQHRGNKTENKHVSLQELCFPLNYTFHHVTLTLTSPGFNYNVTYTLVWLEDDIEYAALIYTVTLLMTLMLTLLAYVIYRCIYYMPVLKYHRLMTEEKSPPVEKADFIKV
ncbi:membrane glycoprotein UL119 [Aotine betaherpesvirus 1]|uniref:Membrane glycoprotein UL119 n=1 Tax=Aotine betaherpesvirus 1 TaxID=50290 RepID=G8XUH6_9BETA|nr:membrane glycoprotein UL119 [Aotine betaherpesvirus 1]AEV80806.1 membrane glycoprotein UL119 [Aotine betaherpesvirus 1]